MTISHDDSASSLAANRFDLAVIGAGPAGLSAACVAAEAGLAVVLLDEQAAPGGQIYRAIEQAGERPANWLDLLGADYAKGGALAARFRRSNAHYRPGQSVFDLSRDGDIATVSAAGAQMLSASRVIIAAGAMERPAPVPGWTLPGVMGAGAAQTLLKSSGLVPDGRTVIAGSGPLLFLVAAQLQQAGANLLAILDTTPSRNYLRAAPLLPRAMTAGSEIRKGLAWRRSLRRGAVPYHSNVSAVRIEGATEVTAIAAMAGRKALRIDCDLVLLHEGVVPNPQLTMAAGASHDFDPLQGCWRPSTDRFGRTSLEAILVAGDCAGIAGAELAVASGELAALAAAADLGRLAADALAARAATSLALIARKAPLRRFLDTLYRPRDEVQVPPDDATIVCRCEEVTAGELRRIASLGCLGPNQAKAFSRCGMGPCQGRMCSLTVSAVLAAASGRSIADTGYLRVRPPIKPITVSELASMDGLATPPADSPAMPTGPTENAAH